MTTTQCAPDSTEIERYVAQFIPVVYNLTLIAAHCLTVAAIHGLSRPAMVKDPGYLTLGCSTTVFVRFLSIPKNTTIHTMNAIQSSQ